MAASSKPPNPRTSRMTVATPSFEMLLEQPVTVTENGVERQFTTEEALQQRVVQSAFAGRRRDIAMVLAWVAKREAARAPRKQKHRAVRTRLEHGDPDNIVDALLTLDIAREWSNPEPRAAALYGRQLLLEPWGVQAALSRRIGARLDADDLSELRRCTRDVGSVRFPGDQR